MHNSEINEDGIIFSHLFLAGPAGFLKNYLPPFPYYFSEISLNLQTLEIMLIFKDVYLYAV